MIVLRSRTAIDRAATIQGVDILPAVNDPEVMHNARLSCVLLVVGQASERHHEEEDGNSNSNNKYFGKCLSALVVAVVSSLL